MKKISFINATILDGTKDMQPMENMTIIVDGGRIAVIEKNGKVAEGSKVIDLQGRFLMPGLINLHVHLPGSGEPKFNSAQNPESVRKLMGNPITRKVILEMCAGYAKTELLSGVTTIRTVGGLGKIDSTIRNEINSGKRKGPRMLVANMAVSVPGGHMADVLAYSAKSVAECRSYIQEIAKDNPDLIKIMITGGVLDATVKGEPGVLRMPLEYVQACCDEAHKLGFHVAAHVESPEGVKVALKGGVDTIEHGAKADKEMIALFKEKGACDICTISPAIPLARMEPELTNSTELTKYNGNIVLQGIIDAAKTALENNIPVGLGTDTACPFVTHYDMWRELAYFHKFVGVSNSFALHTATLGNAKVVGIERETGSIEVGKCADFLVTEKNPLEDLAALRVPYMVSFKGNLIKKPRIKKFAIAEDALDKELE